MPLGDPMGGETPENPRGKLGSISSIQIPVSDMSRAVSFYTEVLDLKIVSDQRNIGWVELALRDSGRIMLIKTLEGGSKCSSSMRAVLATDSIYDLHKVLVDEGVNFTLKPARDRKGRLIARFTDLDGNELEVEDRPYK